MDNGSYESAIGAYEQLEARFPYGRHAQQAQLDTAYAHYKLGEMESVLATADRFIRQYPNHPNVDYAFYLKGLAYENAKIDDWQIYEWLPFLPQQPLSERDSQGVQNAFETYKQLLNRFPDSRYAEDSRQRMQFLLEALATNELNAARYYLKRRAPLAAANRAQIVVTRYATSQSVEEALGLMIQSYKELELETLRRDTERVLRQSFPNSAYLTSN